MEDSSNVAYRIGDKVRLSEFGIEQHICSRMPIETIGIIVGFGNPNKLGRNCVRVQWKKNITPHTIHEDFLQKVI